MNKYGSSVTEHMNKAFRAVEQYAINTGETEDLIAQLCVRMGSWFEDPEPQHEPYFASANQIQLEATYRMLRELNRKHRCEENI
jgi:hypothetical protein|tara:strand:- start:50 stop:301 length:252 start_codon:yes stop_codon:yes gene_type:complete